MDSRFTAITNACSSIFCQLVGISVEAFVAALSVNAYSRRMAWWINFIFTFIDVCKMSTQGSIIITNYKGITNFS